jgi:hypothetical protein
MHLTFRQKDINKRDFSSCLFHYKLYIIVIDIETANTVESGEENFEMSPSTSLRINRTP